MTSLNSLTTPSSHTAPPNGPTWSYIGVGRDDGVTAGEYSPIIYPTSIFNLLHFETVWLSPTPDVPSKGWDAGSIRILTIAVLQWKSSGNRIVAGCTHLDNEGGESRRHSVDIILKSLNKVEMEWRGDVNGKLPVMLAGDFNSFPSQEAYLRMKESGYMYDLRECVERGRRYNDGITFTGFEREKDNEEQGRIDFIWLGLGGSVGGNDEEADSKEGGLWCVDGYAVLPNVLDDGVYLSDHRCVVGDVGLLY